MGFLKSLTYLWKNVVHLGTFENPAQTVLQAFFWKSSSLLHRFDHGPKLRQGPSKIHQYPAPGWVWINKRSSLCKWSAMEALRAICINISLCDMAPLRKHDFFLIQTWALFQVHLSIWCLLSSLQKLFHILLLFLPEKGISGLGLMSTTRLTGNVSVKYAISKLKIIFGNISASTETLFTGLLRGVWQMSLPWNLVYLTSTWVFSVTQAKLL